MLKKINRLMPSLLQNYIDEEKMKKHFNGKPEDQERNDLQLIINSMTALLNKEISSIEFSKINPNVGKVIDKSLELSTLQSYIPQFIRQMSVVYIVASFENFLYTILESLILYKPIIKVCMRISF